MINSYYVKYTLGKRTNEYQLWIAAHDKDEAINSARIQAGFRHGRQYRFNLVDVRDENEPEKAPETVYELKPDILLKPEDIIPTHREKVYASNKCIYYAFAFVLVVALSICMIPIGIITLLQGVIK